MSVRVIMLRESITPSVTTIHSARSDGLGMVCHVAAVHDGSATVAAEWTEEGWLLPTFVVPPHSPQRPLLLQATAALPTIAVPRCLAFPRVDPLTHTIDYTLIADAMPVIPTGDHRLSMIPLAVLRQGRALIAYQQDSISRLTQPLGGANTALQPLWIHGVREWVAENAGVASAPFLAHADIYRASEHSLVVAFTMRGQTLHFKASAATQFMEARATQFIAAVLPEAVAPTIAYNRQRQWWLTKHVDGVHLDASLWPAHLDAIGTWLLLQQRLAHEGTRLSSMGIRRFDDDEMRAAAQDALFAIESSELHRRVSLATTWSCPSRHKILERIERVLDSPANRECAQGLLHLDAAPRNLLWTDRGCVFLDFESVYLGPASICGELMARRMKPALSQPHRRELCLYAAHRALRCGNHKSAASQRPYIEALTDLYRLATVHSKTARRTPSSSRTPIPAYGWSHVAADFVGRADTWAIPH